MEKTVSQSYTEQIQIVMAADIHGSERLFGGRLAQWIDVVAAVVARRHSNCNVTTARIDALEFTGPAYVGETLILIGRITYVGKTSMEVRVDVFVEELDGKRRQINRAYAVLVALDEEERPVEVPRLKLTTDEEKKEFECGLKRAQARKQAREER